MISSPWPSPLHQELMSIMAESSSSTRCATSAAHRHFSTFSTAVAHPTSGRALPLVWPHTQAANPMAQGHVPSSIAELSFRPRFPSRPALSREHLPPSLLTVAHNRAPHLVALASSLKAETPPSTPFSSSPSLGRRQPPYSSPIPARSTVALLTTHTNPSQTP